MPGKAPVSKTPYRVSTPEMLALKMQLQELWERTISGQVCPHGEHQIGLRKRKMIHSGCVLVWTVEQGHYEEQVSFA